MPSIIRQPRAEQDLLDIWLYTFEAWGEQQADDYLDGLSQAFQLLAEQPLMCRQRFELTPAVRIYHHGYHLIVYMALNDGINIIRVLHQSMDMDLQLT